MDDEKWKKAVDKTEEVVFGYCALRENRKAKKASRKARDRSRCYIWLERALYLG